MVMCALRRAWPFDSACLDRDLRRAPFDRSGARHPLASSASATTATAMMARIGYRSEGGRNAAEWIPQLRGPAAFVAIQTRATYRPDSAVSTHAPMRRQY